RVLRAAEVPLLNDAQALRDALERLHADAAQRLAAAADEAREQGRAQGRDEGLCEVRDELAATLTSLTQASAREREQLRGEIGTLALQVVRKLLGHFADDAVLLALADTAAADLLPAQQLTLVVHPEQCPALRERLGDDPRYALRADPACARDTCRIETEHGSVDASLAAQLERLSLAWSSAS
ncbi:MAG TPA: FliH/SctL family protein, partial [Albitalea sp.]|nr:FliH/SctL family protein [Albitalea sp.]